MNDSRTNTNSSFEKRLREAKQDNYWLSSAKETDRFTRRMAINAAKVGEMDMAARAVARIENSGVRAATIAEIENMDNE